MNQYDFIYNKQHLDPQNHFLILCMIQSYYLYIHIQLVLQGIEQFVQVAAKFDGPISLLGLPIDDYALSQFQSSEGLCCLLWA